MQNLVFVREHLSLVLKLGDLRRRISESVKKKVFFLQRASGGEQDRLGPFYPIGNTAGSVFLQYFHVNTCNESLWQRLQPPEEAKGSEDPGGA